MGELGSVCVCVCCINSSTVESRPHCKIPLTAGMDRDPSESTAWADQQENMSQGLHIPSLPKAGLLCAQAVPLGLSTHCSLHWHHKEEDGSGLPCPPMGVKL